MATVDSVSKPLWKIVPFQWIAVSTKGQSTHPMSASATKA
jgi:hypothetical protein